MEQPSPQLRGASRHSVDEKARLILPKRLNGVFGEPGQVCYLTAHPDGCVLMLDQEGFDAMTLEVFQGNPRAGLVSDDAGRKRDLARLFCGLAEEVRIDKAGRIVLPESLRRVLGIEETGREVYVVGAGLHVELWGVARWIEHVNNLVNSSSLQPKVTQPTS
jgi:MraZ protein